MGKLKRTPTRVSQSWHKVIRGLRTSPSRVDASAPSLPLSFSLALLLSSAETGWQRECRMERGSRWGRTGECFVRLNVQVPACACVAEPPLSVFLSIFISLLIYLHFCISIYFCAASTCRPLIPLPIVQALWGSVIQCFNDICFKQRGREKTATVKQIHDSNFFFFFQSGFWPDIKAALIPFADRIKHARGRAVQCCFCAANHGPASLSNTARSERIQAWLFLHCSSKSLFYLFEFKLHPTTKIWHY